MIAPLHYAVSGSVARITLNRPETLNALDPGLARLWRDAAVDAVTRDDASVIVLAGAGRAFCAGGDVKAMAVMRSGEDLATMARVMNEGILALIRSRTPVLAAVHGAVVGGGLGLMLASDFVVADPGARFGALYSRIGATPDMSLTARLAEAIGERRALELLLDDRLLTASEAREWGLIAEVAEAGALAARTDEIVDRWLSRPPGALGDAKALLLSRHRRTIEEQLDTEATTIGAAIERPAAHALIGAFAAGEARRSRPR